MLRTSLAAPDPTTLKKRVWGNSIQKKVQTGMQSVTCLFHNIATLNIIDIVDQLLRATESGRVCMCHVEFTLYITSSGKNFKGVLSSGNND